MTKVRLNKFLSDSGICSRRKADEHILRGDVKVNGEVGKLGQKVDSEKDKVKFLGSVVGKRTENYVYYALNKPKGVVSTASDEKGRKTVVDLVPSKPRVYPVGRLDKESVGLIILTNDGELAQILTHPSSEHEKEYLAIVASSKKQVVSIENIKKRFLGGMSIDGTIMKADKIDITMLRATRYHLLITIHTGYNRQIRKMCAKMGLEILKLKRIRIGKLKLEDLQLETEEFKQISRDAIL